ncbi:MAG: dephospho-CoA kinase [Chloroflexota bacterium]
MLTIGLTGGIGSGKSEASRILEALGARVVNADSIGHQVYRQGEPAWHEVVETFGREVLKDNGDVDRGKLGEIVFARPDRMDALTDIVWPRIREKLQHTIATARTSGQRMPLVVEAAVLFEAGWDDLFDEVWVIAAPREAVFERLTAGKGMSADAAEARIDAQMPVEEKTARADVIVRNDGSLEDLRAEITGLWQERTQGRHIT